MIWPLSLLFPKKKKQIKKDYRTERLSIVNRQELYKNVVLEDSKVFHTPEYVQPKFKLTGSNDTVAHYNSVIVQDDNDDSLTDLLLINSVLNDDFRQGESYGVLSEDVAVDNSADQDFGGGDFDGGGAGSDWSDNSSSSDTYSSSDSSYDSSSSDSSSSDCGSSD